MVPEVQVFTLHPCFVILQKKKVELHLRLLFLSQDGIVSFLKKQAGPASVELKTDADFEKFIGDQDASVVGEFCFSHFLS